MITPITTDDADAFIKPKPWPRSVYFSGGEVFVCKDNTFTNTEAIDYTLHTSECFAPDDTVEGDDVAGLLLLGAMLGGALVGLIWFALS